MISLNLVSLSVEFYGGTRRWQNGEYILEVRHLEGLLDEAFSAAQGNIDICRYFYGDPHRDRASQIKAEITAGGFSCFFTLELSGKIGAKLGAEEEVAAIQQQHAQTLFGGLCLLW